MASFAPPAADGLVTTASPDADKLALFSRLFSGRSDVHTHGYRRKDGKIGYPPACAHEWQRGVCPRTSNRKTTCVDCPQREFLPLSEPLLKAHFQGRRSDLRDVLGVYAIDQAGNVRFLVADFDGDAWRTEATAYRNAGKRLGIDVALERPRSGIGAHAWIFFQQPTPARTARQLGGALIAGAMAHDRALTMQAYDRFIPAQDTVPDGGFGNLIALPFQGAAMRSDNSVFLDEDLNRTQDQWLALSKVRPATPDDIAAAIASAPEPPTRQRAGQRTPETPSFGSGPLVIEKRGTLDIPTKDLDPAAVDALRRLASYGNPAFFKAQAMRLSTRLIPRVITLAEENSSLIRLPRGCVPDLQQLLDAASVPWRLVDRRPVRRPIALSFTGALRPEQQRATSELLRHESVILEAPTGSGKTVMTASLMATLGARTLVLVPSTALVGQWVDRLNTFLQVNEPVPVLMTKAGKPRKKQPPRIGTITGGKERRSGLIDICTYQSALTKDAEVGWRPKEFLQDYDLVICDECHHAGALLLERALKATTARHVYGLSVTPRRADGLDRSLALLFGEHRVRLEGERHAQRTLVTRFTRSRLPQDGAKPAFNDITDAVIKDKDRNAQLVEDTLAALDAGRTPLVLTRRKTHARTLAENLAKAGAPTILLAGSDAKERQAALNQLASIPAEQPFVIVATMSYLGEGFDEPRLDTLVLATPVSWEGSLTQFVGRVERRQEGKHEVRVIDYADCHVPMLDRMYRKLLRAYRKMGYEPAPAGPEQSAAQILGAASAEPVLLADINGARSIEIRSPYLSPARVKALAPALESAIQHGAAIHITTRRPQNPGASDSFRRATLALRLAGCAVEETDEPLSGLMVFDRRIVWFGDAPLGRWAEETALLRFDSPAVAGELLES